MAQGGCDRARTAPRRPRVTKTALGVLASGGGSNFEALDLACREGRVPAEIKLLLVNRSSAGALAKAEKRGVPAKVLEPVCFSTREEFNRALLREFRSAGVQVLCLAGYLLKIEEPLLSAYEGKILNIHPALLPHFGGAGYFGHKVHEAVLSSGVKETGCTVHLVDAQWDHGAILAQSRVPVLAGDTPDSLAARVLQAEHRLYPQALKLFLNRSEVQ